MLVSRDLDRYQDGAAVTVAGQILVHQAPPTAKGHHFITLEDEAGFLNIIVRPDEYAQYRRVLRLTFILGLSFVLGGGVVGVCEKARQLICARAPIPASGVRYKARCG
ncbi:MAG: hypothetical protein IPK17_32345 [Chloroflexi bacterium]|uniref:hypothetical protein n=1 Tax=Candidatus Flexifilum breve TaxID=3140694 RepID=UPI003136C2DC|nr:hypothetical protein [Chloroflexota bacterium]